MRRFAVAVTGDHSTPAVYGDHSHEPVPFAIAHVRHAVRRICIHAAERDPTCTAVKLHWLRSLVVILNNQLPLSPQ